MHWSKTKTILIIALLITNAVMLGYLYSENRLQRDAAVSDRMVYMDVISVLKARNIQVAFQGMPKTEGVQAVEAAYETYDLAALAPHFLTGKATVNPGGTEAVAGQESLRFLDGIKLIYENKGLPEVVKAPAEEEALEMARKFLSLHGYPLDENTILSSVKVNGQEIEVVYGQQTSHRQIENGVMRLVVTDQGVRSFERKWLKILKVREMTYVIIPPGRALLRLSEILSEEQTSGQPVVITAMTLGYKLETESLNTNILSGELSPYWRFTTRSGITYPVKALQ